MFLAAALTLVPRSGTDTHIATLLLDNRQLAIWLNSNKLHITIRMLELTSVFLF